MKIGLVNTAGNLDLIRFGGGKVVGNGDMVEIDGVKISTELIKDVLCASGRRRYVVSREGGVPAFVESVREGSRVTFKRYVTIEPTAEKIAEFLREKEVES